MPFSDKLNILMKIQHVSNVRLAKALAVDASLISRWRTGTRVPPKNNNYIKAIASYFATQAKMDYQKAALYEIMGKTNDKSREEIPFLCNCLYTWLCDEAPSNTQFIDGFINKLTMFGKSKISLPQIEENDTYSHGLPLNAEIFSGIEGKRKGVLRFLAAVSAQKKPCTMLLYSDESMEWLTEDKAFYMKWGAMLIDIISKGHRIKIIHTINRDLSEMLSAIDRWLPLYMTGAIEPYYYPRYHAHIFRRTMFIAPDVAALTSNSLTEYSKNADQVFYTDSNRIASLTDEFNAYLGLCRPLMQIFNQNNIDTFYDLQLEFEDQSGNCITFYNMLSSVTIPESMFSRLLDQSALDAALKEKLMTAHLKRIKAFESNLKHSIHTDIISLPSPSNFANLESLVKPIDFFYEVNLYYAQSDFAEHVQNVIRFMEKYSNYNLIICSQSFPDNTYLSVKEEVGVIVAKNDISPIVFAFNQQNLTRAFHSYLEDIIKGIPHKQRSRKYVIKMLQELLEPLV